MVQPLTPVIYLQKWVIMSSKVSIRNNDNGTLKYLQHIAIGTCVVTPALSNTAFRTHPAAEHDSARVPRLNVQSHW